MQSDDRSEVIEGGGGRGGGVEINSTFPTFFVYTIKNFRAGESLAEHEAAVAASVIGFGIANYCATKN